MSTLTLEREFAADPETVFKYITKTEHLMDWWGPEGLFLKDYTLDFTQPGDWSSTLVNAEGGTHKMSGTVTAINPPHSVEFTWGWHDENDKRGHESRVRLEVKPGGSGGTHFTLTHSNLPSDEAATSHSKGWGSMLNRLERLASHSSPKSQKERL